MNRLMVKPMPPQTPTRIELPPARAVRQAGEAQPDQQTSAGKDAELLAEEETGHDAERDRIDDHVRA